jgi:ATP-dependent Clp protease adaptor protein ClpS
MSNSTTIKSKRTDSSLRVERPKKYAVVFLNDDVTSFDFVINSLKSQFRFSTDDASDLAFQIHTEGKAVAGVYSYEIAETLTFEVMTRAAEQQFPLTLTTEEV